MPRRRKDSEDNIIINNNNNNEEEDDDYDDQDDHEMNAAAARGDKCSRNNGGRPYKTTNRKLHNNNNNNNNKLHKPIQRNAANARERSRMRVLSKAFSKLKTTLPWVPPDTKLSKLDTLRLASSYIAHLQQILDAESEAAEVENGGGHHRGSTYIHPLNLTWPFTFNGRTAALNEGKSPEPMKCPIKPQGTIQC